MRVGDAARVSRMWIVRSADFTGWLSGAAVAVTSFTMETVSLMMNDGSYADTNFVDGHQYSATRLFEMYSRSMSSPRPGRVGIWTIPFASIGSTMDFRCGGTQS
jgi:hypothetical protein